LRRTKAEALETREALLDAAEAVFFEKGVSRTSLTDIASAAGLTRGAIYWHFADKVALFEAMVERGSLPQEYVARVVQAHGAPDPLELIHGAALDSLRFLSGNERAKRICTIMLLRCEFVGEMERVLDRMRQADESMFRTVIAAFEEAERRHFLSREWTAETATIAHMSTMSGLITHWLKYDCPFDLLAAGEGMMRSLFEGFRSAAGCEKGLLRSA
jgi:TetR/AcrR family transcriptional regulator, acrAB operon repressor